MGNNNFFKKDFENESGVSTNMLRALYAKMKKDPTISEKYKLAYLTPERMASEYLNLWIYPPDIDYSRNLPTIKHKTNDGKDVKVEQMYLSDYDICYRAARVTVEKDGEVLNQTVIGNNMMFELEVAEILEYARLMYPEEEFNHLMQHVAKCVEKIPYVPAMAEYDSSHVTNGRKFKRAFKRDILARKVIKEVKALNKEKERYDKEKKQIDVLNDSRKAEMNAKVVLTQPAPNVNKVITTDRFTQRDRDE